MNMLLLDALKCKNKSRPPIWLMRQAGRYMPEYRALRAKHTFLEMCHHPELIAEVTQLPLRTFGLDAAILFSDILVIPEALGVGLRFDEGIGPIIERPLRDKQGVEQLPKTSMKDHLSYVTEGIKLLLPELKVPLIGFSGAPFTLASYMIEGGGSRDLRKTKQWMVRDPESFHQLLSKLADCVIEYLNMQIDAGVQALQLFDSWAHFLSHDHFDEFSAAYMQKILKGIKPNVPVIVFCRGSSIFAEQLAAIKPAAVSLDWQCDLAKVRQKLGPQICLQGNLDPDILYAPESVIRKEANALLRKMKGDPGFIFNLGHGMNPDMSPDAVKALVDAVKTNDSK